MEKHKTALQEKAYKFRIYPNKIQEQQIQQFFGSCRYVWNYYLNKRIELYKTNGYTLNYIGCSKDMTELKKELNWLNDTDSMALQSSLKALDTAYNNFFRGIKKNQKIGFPKFKSKKSNRKSYLTKSAQVLEKHVKLPKLGKVKCAVSKQIRGRILNATISQNPSGKYFVSVCCTDVDIPQYESTGAVIGLDLGLTSLMNTSDGISVPNMKFLYKSESKLAKLQKLHSRKTIGSNRRNKARIKVAKCHEKISNQRNDLLHKLTTELVKNYDVICVEDLAVANMLKNHCLAKAISDVSWGELLRQLEYKCLWQHKAFVKCNRFFASSQICNNCGHKNKETKNLSVRFWKCPSCGSAHDRDTNAAINILMEGLKILEFGIAGSARTG
jgi:putative transposase